MGLCDITSVLRLVNYSATQESLRYKALLKAPRVGKLGKTVCRCCFPSTTDPQLLLAFRPKAGNACPKRRDRMLVWAESAWPSLGRWLLRIAHASVSSLMPLKSDALLADASAYVRGWAIQLIMEVFDNEPPATFVEKFREMAREDDSRVVRAAEGRPRFLL